MTERERALRILRRVDREKAFAAPLLTGESGFVRTLVLGVLRWQSLLDHAIAEASGRKIAQVEPLVLDILRLGTYQIHFMDVPRYAAVSETVDLASSHAKRAAGFVNAVLRKVGAAPLPEPSDPATRWAHPEWLYARWTSFYGARRAAAIAEANQELSFADVLVLEGDPPERSDKSIFVEDVVRVTSSTADLDRARFYPMDEGSAVVASIAASCAAGGDVLDLAAAPGGKSLLMARRGAKVISNDVSLARLQPLARRSQVLVSDGRQLPFRGRFTTVLLDAPCSATGTIRKSPELKWRMQPEEVSRFVGLQRELLDAALGFAENHCVYSTCSLEPEENDAVVNDILKGHPEFEVGDVAQFTPAAAERWIDGRVLRLTPDAGTDGFTVFVLTRTRS